MSSLWEKQAISRLLRESILHVCKNQQVYGGQFDVDAIVCISGQAEGQEIVVKIHERLGTNAGSLALTDFLARPREGWSSVIGVNHQEDNAEDYSLKRRRIDDSGRGSRTDDSISKSHDADSYPNLKQHLMNPSHHSRDLREIHDLRKNGMQNRDTTSTGIIEVSPLSPGMEQSTSFSSEVDMSEPQSPPPGSQYPFTSTPHSIFPRRIPLRSDRWSPNQPIPSVPECKPCGYTFSSFDGLSDHNEAVHSVFTCQSCFKTFTSRSNLERHSRLHTGHRPYGCTICGKTFSRKDHLSNHATKHAYKCGTCSKRFNDKKLLVTHYSYDHNAVLTNICELCNKGFSSADQYEEHLKVHPQCMSGRDEEDDLCMPQNLSTSPASPLQANLVCKTCQFRTADKLTMIKHRIIHQDNARCYTCLSCAKMYDDPLHYSDHLLIHSDETNIFECCICRQICPTLTSLRRHEATHIHLNIDEDLEQSDVDQENFNCTRCDKTFPSAELLEDHLELHQKSESGFACTVCQQEYDNYGEICSHIEQEGHYVYPNRDDSVAVPRNADDTPKNKRKQKLPKSVKNLEEMSPESDVEIVEPESPEDTAHHLSNGGPAGYIAHTNTGEFLVTDNPAPVIEITPEDGRRSPATHPIKSLLSQTIHARVKQDPIPDKNQRPANTRPIPSKRSKNKSPEKASTSMNASSPETNNNNNILLSPKLMNVEIPEGPYTCSICSSIHPSFQELEMHCFSEHNRSPCMFCSKTFAQKANRDRHVCLHTGDKPYSCPNCNEKFSRGDKLKIHRMRAHQTAFPNVVKGAKELAGSPVDSPAGGLETGREASDDGQPASALDGLYGTDWSMRRDVSSEFVAVTGEWSVREVDDSGIDNGNDLTADESK